MDKLTIPSIPSKDDLMGLVFKMYGIDPKLELADPNFADDEVLEVVDQYISNCEKYHIPPDPSVLISLGTGWNVLKPTSKFTEGHLLSLFDILCENTHVTHLGSIPLLLIKECHIFMFPRFKWNPYR